MRGAWTMRGLAATRGAALRGATLRCAAAAVAPVRTGCATSIISSPAARDVVTISVLSMRYPPGRSEGFLPRSPADEDESLSGVLPDVVREYVSRVSCARVAAGDAALLRSVTLHQASGDEVPAVDQHEEDQLERQRHDQRRQHHHAHRHQHRG